MYEFLSDGLLTGHDVTDRQLLLMSQDFFLDEGLMFHHNSAPNKKKLSKVVNAAPRLCLPANYVTEVLQILHDFLGHSGRDRLFLTARERYYRKNLYQCVSEYVASCDLCLRTKTNKAKSIDPLHPIRVPNGPGLMYATDHLVLSRKTVNNETAIVVFICAFSGWCFIELVKDTSALEAARAFIRRVLPVMSLSPNTVLISDKGSAYTSKFFAHLCQALNISHLTSAVGKGQSNGRAESLVKKCKEMIKFYAPDDRHLADCIPIIELAIRSTISSVTKFSPFQMLMGRQPPLPTIANEPANLALKCDQLEYYRLITSKLAEVRKEVGANIELARANDERQFNRRHRVQVPKWSVGQQVLFEKSRVTNEKFTGPYFVSAVVQKDDIGSCYQLTRVSDGKLLKYLISGDRLRLYTVPQRRDFLAKYPPLPGQDNLVSDNTPGQQDNDEGHRTKALRLLA